MKKFLKYKNTQRDGGFLFLGHGAVKMLAGRDSKELLVLGEYAFEKCKLAQSFKPDEQALKITGKLHIVN